MNKFILYFYEYNINKLNGYGDNERIKSIRGIYTMTTEDMIRNLQIFRNTVCIQEKNIIHEAINRHQEIYNENIKHLYKVYNELKKDHIFLQDQMNTKELTIFILNNKLNNEEFTHDTYNNRSYSITNLSPLIIMTFGDFLDTITYNELLKEQYFQISNVKQHIIMLTTQNNELSEAIKYLNQEIKVKEAQVKELELYNKGKTNIKQEQYDNL